MPDRDQQLIEAAMRYLQLLEGDRPVSIHDYVASLQPELREELAPYLEQVLAVDVPEEPSTISSEEQAMAGRVAARVRERMQERTAAPGPRTLAEARMARKLSLAALAKQLNVPPDLLARIERGGVRAATIPNRFVARLAGALQQAEAEIHRLLSAPLSPSAGVRLSAQDATVVPPEEVVSFAEALQASAATAAQREEWS